MRDRGASDQRDEQCCSRAVGWRQVSACARATAAADGRRKVGGGAAGESDGLQQQAADWTAVLVVRLRECWDCLPVCAARRQKVGGAAAQRSGAKLAQSAAQSAARQPRRHSSGLSGRRHGSAGRRLRCWCACAESVRMTTGRPPTAIRCETIAVWPADRLQTQPPSSPFRLPLRPTFTCLAAASRLHCRHATARADDEQREASRGTLHCTAHMHVHRRGAWRLVPVVDRGR